MQKKTSVLATTCYFLMLVILEVYILLLVRHSTPQTNHFENSTFLHNFNLRIYAGEVNSMLQAVIQLNNFVIFLHLKPRSTVESGSFLSCSIFFLTCLCSLFSFNLSTLYRGEIIDNLSEELLYYASMMKDQQRPLTPFDTSQHFRITRDLIYFNSKQKKFAKNSTIRIIIFFCDVF